jgi:hypothetical protein
MEEIKHNNGGGYGPHPGNCPACIAKHEAEKAERAKWVNPHRPGTKVHAQWERENRNPPWYLDLRSERYWSM